MKRNEEDDRHSVCNEPYLESQLKAQDGVMVMVFEHLSLGLAIDKV